MKWLLVLALASCTREPIVLDGHLSDWKGTARTGAFVDSHNRAARPFSEARFLRDDTDLYLALYAADEDIHARNAPHDSAIWIDDAFTLRFGTSQIDVNAAGAVTDVRAHDISWESGITVAIDCDGTLNDDTDEDEEWIVEAKIPRTSLESEEVEIERCDKPKGARRTCSSATIDLDD